MTKYALVVGVSDYQFNFNLFPQAIKNAEAIEEVLLAPEFGKFERNNIKFLANPERQTIEKAIKELFSARQTDDLVMFFFSGRIIKDRAGRLYLAAQNTRTTRRGTLIRSSAITAKFLRRKIDSCKSKRKAIFFDSCFNFLNDDDDKIVNIEKELLARYSAIATSASSDRYCFGSPGQEISPYTYYLVEGIKSAEADLDYDGSISIKELHQYAKEKVQQINPQVEPEIYLPPQNSSLELLKVYINNPEEKYFQNVLKNSIDGQITLTGRKNLDALKKRFNLSQARAEEIEARVVQTLEEELQQKLARFELDFTEALKQEISPSEADFERLKENLQIILGLTDEQTREIATKVKSEVETYKKHLETYERKLLAAMRQENPLSQITRQKLERMQTLWKLSDRDVALAESRMTFEMKSYSEKLLEYEAELTKAIQQEQPLSPYKRNSLIEKQKSLGILDEDIAEIQSRLSSEIEASKQKLQKYKQVLALAIENNYPLTEDIRDRLREVQEILKLSDEDVIKIESQIIREKRLNQSLIQPKLSTNLLPTTDITNKIVPVSKTNKSSTLNRINLPIPSNQLNKINLPNLAELASFLKKINLNRRSYLKWMFFLIVGGFSSFLAKLFINWVAQTNRTDSTLPNRDKAPSLLKNPPVNLVKNEERSFEVVTIDSLGKEISRTTEKAKYLSEDLGQGIELEMIYVPAGNFLMGTPTTEVRSRNSERPQHQVRVKAFLMGKYQVTQAQWRQVANLPQIERNLKFNPSHFKGDDLPVEQISWYEAIEFCKRLSQKTGHKYRLPSEAEWEYACRAGTNTPFHFGSTITTNLANYNGRYVYNNIGLKGRFRGRTTTVGSFSANAFGLYDMHGNVWEWCQDTWHDNYRNAPTDGSPWISNNARSYVIRGGSWSKDPTGCRSGHRESHHTGGYKTLGLRVVREI